MRHAHAPIVHAETIGSLRHPEELIKARHDYEAKTITRDALQAVEDRAVREAVAMQERLGFKVVTDGELRRDTYVDFVFDGLTGVRLEWQDQGQGSSYRNSTGEAATTPRPVFIVFDRIKRSPGSSGAKHFQFLRSVAKEAGKATIAGPAIIHFFAGRAAISSDVYPRLDEFWADLIAAYHSELRHLHAAGCTYIQFDETSLIKLVDADIRAWITGRGDDPDQLLRTYVDVMQAIAAGAPKDMRIGLHLCHGNNRGTWQAQGGYDTIAEQIFQQISADVFLLEYDSPRAGSFEPLRHLPDDKMVILGLLSTKQRLAEDADQVIARIREAETIVPLERLGVSPQCGFWGGMNLCTAEEQEAKLRRVIEIAQRVWR